MTLLQEWYLGSAIFDEQCPDRIACENSHRPACLVIRESIIQQLGPLQINRNGLLNNFAELWQEWSFWLPSSEWYVQGPSLSDNLRNYRNTFANYMAQLPTNQTINHDSVLLNQLIERPTTAIYLTQHSKVG
jgi:hypothetical protein